jgi:hypothetical protein
MECILCGEYHKLNSSCPCPRCGQCHQGNLCPDACAICNLFHDGSCSGRITSGCSLCGEGHNAFVTCPCPRCHVRHECGDCRSVEEWQFHPSNYNGNFSMMIGSCCALCGVLHSALSRCPCPRCHGMHSCSQCPDVCDWCNSCHEHGCADEICIPCLFCGESHDVIDACFSDNSPRPCSGCNVWHGDDSCVHQPWRVSSRTAVSRRPCHCCNIWHGDTDCDAFSCATAAVQPCQRCNTWHGADVCAHSEILSTEYRPVRISRAIMRNRAVGNDARAMLIDAVAPAHSDAASDRHDVGPMSVSCTHCGARFWKGERIQCCFGGSLIMPEPIVPSSLSDLILSPAVRLHLRSYNMAMAMASVGHEKVGFPDGVFHLSGRSYHQIGTLEPRNGQDLCFAQIYTLDTAVATDRRSQLFSDRLDKAVLSQLHDELVVHNRYVSQFCRAASSDVHELVWSTADDIMGMQMGALICSNGYQRSIVIKRRADENCPYAYDLQFINDGHSMYHPLAYPLLFPTGNSGWFHGMSRCELNGTSMTPVSLHDYGRYSLMHRERSVCLARGEQLSDSF